MMDYCDAINEMLYYGPAGSEYLRLNKPIEIRDVLTQHLEDKGFEGISVEEVEVTPEGTIDVIFSDYENELLLVSFLVDEDGPIAMVSDEENDGDDMPEDVYVIDLSPLSPTVVMTEYGPFISFSSLQWLNKSTLKTIFTAGDFEYEVDETYEFICEDMDEARKISVIRGGKRVRLPVVRKVRRKRMTPKMRAGIRKAVIKRRRKKTQTQRKFKRSLRIRKSQNIKKPKLNKNQKVAGTKNRPLSGR